MGERLCVYTYIYTHTHTSNDDARLALNGVCVRVSRLLFWCVLSLSVYRFTVSPTRAQSGLSESCPDTSLDHFRVSVRRKNALASGYADVSATGP